MTILSGEISTQAPPVQAAPTARLGASYLGMAALADLLLAAEILKAENIPMRGWSARIKRLADIVLSATLLIVLAPVMAIIAFAIKAGSDGPAIFRQPPRRSIRPPFHDLEIPHDGPGWLHPED